MQGYTFACTDGNCSKHGWKQMGVTIELVLEIGEPLCDGCDEPMTLIGEDESRYTVIQSDI